jgi:2-polyprenyl-6-methoxyphenol hydroxylase-like FAD-dependent oxidoreductase
MMAGLLFARAGCNGSVVLEKHADFFRDFRGDTVHPSTMEILDQLGMLEALPEAPAQRNRQGRAEDCRAASGRSATYRTSTRQRRSSR